MSWVLVGWGMSDEREQNTPTHPPQAKKQKQAMERDRRRRSMCSSTGLVLLFFRGCAAFLFFVDSLFCSRRLLAGSFCVGGICGPFGPSVHWYFSLSVCLSIVRSPSSMSRSSRSGLFLGPCQLLSSRRRRPRSPLHQPTQPFLHIGLFGLSFSLPCFCPISPPPYPLPSFRPLPDT